MTAPVTGFTINIRDDGTATFQAADRSAEGHLWAIPAREIPLERVQRIAEILGPDAREGFEARVVHVKQLLTSQAAREEEALARATAARAALRNFETLLPKCTCTAQGGSVYSGGCPVHQP